MKHVYTQDQLLFEAETGGKFLFCENCDWYNEELGGKCMNASSEHFEQYRDSGDGCPEYEDGEEESELPATRPEPMQVVSLDEARSLIGSMSGQIGALAEMLRVTNERMQALENEVRSLGAAVRTLEKVTPQQASRINKAIRERGLELCREYRIGVTITPVAQGVGSVPEQARFEASAEKAKKISAAIRAEVRTMAGAKTAREVARCDYETVIGYVQAWEDYETIQRIRRG